MTTDELREKLTYTKKNGYTLLTPEQRAEMNAYAKRYAAFMDACKTEREATSWAEAEAQAKGFQPMTPGKALKPGDKVYLNNRGKNIYLAVIGSAPLEEGMNLCAAHIDSPRLDLKPMPLYEDSEFAYFKTNYYGGVKKYQWPTIPLALHGVVSLQDGSVVTVKVGEDPEDPVLFITDLLIHLAREQMQKSLAEGITAEQLNVLLGTEPLEGEGADLVKLNILRILNEKYGITEADFRSAELTMVPAGKCREAGLDRSLLSAYGHDDRVCAYAALEPILELENPVHTCVCVLADREEIGSVGISGMQSRAFDTFVADICKSMDADPNQVLKNSFCLSSDVANAYDPTFADAFDRRNTSYVNYGVAIMKYTGRGGKSGASDASAEALGHVRKALDGAGVLWQINTIGRVDLGGGGTVAGFMANRNIVTVDAGVPLLGMHAPMELVGKLDAYMMMKASQAIYEV